MKVPVPDTLLPADQLGTVHFVGIGGAGLSGIARIMLARGITVSGSDAKESRTIEALRVLGATCHIGHDASHLGDADTVVVSTAVRDSNPEVVAATERGLRLLPRSAALESVMQGRTVVAVAGTHGKTTTTSLLTVALQHCGADPSFAIGGELNETGSNAHDGSGDLFVAEADESDGAFLVYTPHAALVTNVEADHLDNYGTEEAYRAAFDTFVGRVSPEGFVVVVADDPGADALGRTAVELGRTVVRVGERSDAEVRAEDLRFHGSGSRVRGRRPRSQGSARCTSRSPAATTCSTRWPPSPAACGSASPSPTWRAVSVRSPGRDAGWSSRARSTGSGSTTATPITPTRSRATSRPPGRSSVRAASWSRSSRTWSRAPGSSATTWAWPSGRPTTWW